MEIHVYGKSVAGNSRQHNEDQIFCQGHYRKDLDELQDMYKGRGKVSGLLLFAIFDGMGGLANGERASGICSEMIAEHLREDISGKKQFHAVDSIMEMNRRIAENRRISKMGSTAVVAECRDKTLQVTNIGDSRAYWLRGRDLTRLSVDHTLEERMKKLRPEYKAILGDNEFQKHALTQYVGVPEDEFLIEPHISERITVEGGDQCLLCSDGLTNLVTEEQITEVLAKDTSNEKKVNELMDNALQNDKTDNISVILIRWVQ